MWDSDRQGLPEWLQEAYEIIVDNVNEPAEGIPRERAIEVLLAHEDFPDETADADYAIERLRLRGWVYELGSDIRITDYEQ